MLGHDLSYLLDVLNISADETEDQLDERLTSEAKELGVDVEAQKTEERQFRVFIPEYPRRSDSIDSRASQSTGLASTFSDHSRDQAQFAGNRRRSRGSLNFRDYDAFVSRGVPNGRHSISFTPLTTPSHSTLSLPLSQPSSPDVSSPKRHFRRIRGLGMLKLHSRNGSDAPPVDACPHCPESVANQRRAVHKLPCGHRLCTQALRSTIQTATQIRSGAVPSCCGRPIPGSLVEQVMTQEEQNALLDKLEQWDEIVSVAPSLTSSRRESILSTALSAYHPPLPPTQPQPYTRPDSPPIDDNDPVSIEENRSSPEQTLPFKDRKEMDKVMARKDYQLIRTGQGEQRDRFLRWAEQRQALQRAEHERARDEVRSRHEAAAEEMAEEQAAAMAEAEDKQVQAEADMRTAQEREGLDTDTALQYMEAYCDGRLRSGAPHGRLVTDQDRAERDKQRRRRDTLPAKHASQVNVLRGEQARRIRLRAARQNRELLDLHRRQRQAELGFERACSAAAARLDDDVAARRRKLQWRWELQMAVFAKKVEAESSASIRLPCALPTADCPMPFTLALSSLPPTTTTTTTTQDSAITSSA